LPRIFLLIATTRPYAEIEHLFAATKGAAMPVNPIPTDYPRVTPYLCVDGAGAAIDFYTTVFGASERMRMPEPSGKIGHAELQLGDSMIMLADEFPEIGVKSPQTIGGTPVTISIYVEDVDAVFARALANGAESLRAVEDQFYGDRAGQFLDPFGHRWSVASRIEELSAEEMAARATAPEDGQPDRGFPRGEFGNHLN
jgi:PhnB protein